MYEQFGVIKFFLLMIGGLLLLSFFNIDVRAFIELPVVQKIISLIWTFGHDLWTLTKPGFHIAFEFMLEYVWTPVSSLLDLDSGTATSTRVSS